MVFKFVLCPQQTFSFFPGGSKKKKGRKDPLMERVLIFVVIGHHTIDIPEISLRFLSFAITTFGFSVRVKCYRHA